jgi:hypothetical protein
MPVATAPKFIEIKVDGFLARKRGREVLRAIERGMLQGARQAIPTIKRFTPVASGFLRDNYQINFRRGPRRALITNPATYVGVMELGRRPNRRRPPIGPIMAWVTRKLGVPANEVRGVAFAIARNIGTFGIGVTRGRRNFTGKFVPSLVRRTGKGNMFTRAVRKLGADFFGRKVAQEVARLK